MFKPILPLSKISGWNVQQTPTATAAHTVLCEIQPGPRFHNILITGNAGTAKKMTDLIGDIRVICDDEVVRLHSATELNAKSVLYGPIWAADNGNLAAGTFQLPIFFSEPWRKDTLTGDKLAWNTRNLRNFRIEVDIKATTYDTAAALSFQGEGDYAPLDSDAPGKMGLIVKCDRTTLNLATGWNDVMSFPRSGVYQEINLVSTAITDIEIRQGQGGIIMGPLSLAQLRARQKHRDMEPLYRAATSPATTTIGGTDHAATRGMTDIVFDADDRPVSGLVSDPSKDFNVRLNISAGANVVALYNRLAPL
jgi:hypothetical protein